LDLKGRLAEAGWESEETPLAPDALVLKKRGNIFQTQLIKDGQFEVQDAGSQCIAPFLQAEPGMWVVDACAGAGGKALHLAALMKNKGRIIALDTEDWKLEELSRRARRNGVHIVQPRPIESSKTIKRLHGAADRLLLDVPCSGLGVLRRNPDAKWKLSPEFLENVKVAQEGILENYSKILKPNGRMVYATCSIFPSENERQVEKFLARHPQFKLLDERKISPANDGFDGFYMALLEKTA
jgi:16S rRNA (cytosine967-C5)-methyltransferase